MGTEKYPFILQITMGSVIFRISMFSNISVTENVANVP
jgi:ABC-type proline/glycine betaine transport system ATPase subunit